MTENKDIFVFTLIQKQEVKDKKPIKRRLPHHPSWLQAVDWTENVKMQYQLPKNTMPLVLEDDWSKLSQIPHPVSVASQLKELGDIVQIDSTHQAVVCINKIYFYTKKVMVYH